MKEYSLRQVTTEQFAEAVALPEPVVVLLPVGSVEPHGPHLTLLTDAIISEASAQRAAEDLQQHGMRVFVAPTIPFGVTECAADFKGAISIPADVLANYLAAAVKSFLDNGVDHVCLVNNHLEPDHYEAVLSARARFAAAACSVACPLARRWARTLSDEFKRGECHAGRYETALVLAADPSGVRTDVQMRLPEVPISLSDALKAGQKRFTEMGMTAGYAGAPAAATAREGREMLQRLAEMIVTEVLEALEALRAPPMER